jgi:hypothetical protein
MLLARYDEGGDVKAHFRELNRLCQIIAGMGTIVNDKDYAAIVMGSLPDIYRPIISTLEAAAGYSSKVVTAQELITTVNVEYKHRLLRNPQSARKGRNATLHVGNSTRQGQGATKDTICYNCNKTGHFKMDCWSKGGSKDRQVKDREMVAKPLLILLPPLPLHPPIIMHLHLLPPSNLGEAAQS